MKYRISVLQYEPIFLKPMQNHEVLSDLLSNIVTDLVVLPELALSGYVFQNQEEVDSVAESIPDGEIFKDFQALSAKKDMSIVYGFAERALDNYYNSAALINPDGSYAIYRKIQLFYREKLFFSPGDRPYFVSTAKSEVKIGMMICFDWQFPEAARSLALQGAQIITHPSNLVLPWCQEAMRTRSLENHIFSITSNRIGTEQNGNFSHTFTGQSQILGTKGEILIRMNDTETGIYTVEIDAALANDKSITEFNDAFQDRRPDMYKLI